MIDAMTARKMADFFTSDFASDYGGCCALLARALRLVHFAPEGAKCSSVYQYAM